MVDRNEARRRLAECVEQGYVDDCWPFKGAKSSNGYPSISIGNKTFSAHRLAFFVENGYWAKPMTLHKCKQNKMCCNPAHLYEGDAKQNAQDRDADNTTARGERSGTRLHPECVARGEHHVFRIHPEKRPRGERVGSAKLTELRVIGIMARFLQGVSLSQIARENDVGTSTIWRIVNGYSWKHVFGGESSRCATF